MSVLHRTDQGIGVFSAADPLDGYYNDLSPVLDQHTTLDDAENWLEAQLNNRDTANPVGIVQLGLAAWQRGQATDEMKVRAKLYRIVDTVADWLIVELADPDHGLEYRWPMTHTYQLPAPWQSSMAIGQAISLLVRAGRASRKASADKLSAGDRLTAADRAVGILIEAAAQHGPLAPETESGTVFQEYPTTPPAHVLNGWIWTLWGLHDASVVDLPNSAAAGDAWSSGLTTLVRTLPRYEVGRGWSRYDLFPHPIRHFASPFYHRLHIALLRATHQLAPQHPELGDWADRFERATTRPLTQARAVLAKGLFRFIRPRRKG